MCKYYVSFFAILFLICSCKKDELGESLINPSDSNTLTQVLIMPSGSQIVNGQPPSPTGQGAPSATNPNSTALGSNGSTAPLNFRYANVQGNLGGCYVQVVGANSYFNIPYNSTSGASGQLSVPIGIPTNVDLGEFCVDFCIYDANGRISNIVRTCVTVIRLGSGALQVSLTWSNSSDQDLYVITPSGCEIHYANSVCQDGLLDRDDLDGYGPENIFWESNASDGTYEVWVDDFSSVNAGTDLFININAPGTSRQFSGRTVNGNKVKIVTFQKSGNSIIF